VDRGVRWFPFLEFYKSSNQVRGVGAVLPKGKGMIYFEAIGAVQIIGFKSILSSASVHLNLSYTNLFIYSNEVLK